MINGVIFDKDGTLLEFSDFWIDETINFIKTFKLDQKDEEKLLLLLGIEGRKVIENSLLASATIKDIAHFIGDFLKEDQEEIYKNLDDFYYTALKKNKDQIKTTCNVKRLFEELKNRDIKIAIVSSDNYRQSKFMFEHLSLSSFIDFYATGDLYKRKPEKEAFYAFLDEFSLKADEIMVCGDSKCDMEFGDESKLRIGIANGTGSKEMLSEYADLVLESPEEILSYLD